MSITKRELVMIINGSLASNKMEWQDIPWCCSCCNIQFQKYEDMTFKTLGCGCSQELCSNCIELLDKWKK